MAGENPSNNDTKQGGKRTIFGWPEQKASPREYRYKYMPTEAIKAMISTRRGSQRNCCQRAELIYNSVACLIVSEVFVMIVK